MNPEERTSNTPVAVVTGAAGGIGRAICHRLGEAGYAVIATDVDARGEQLSDELAARGIESSFLAADLTAGDSVRGLIDSVLEKYGSLDVAVNNAGTIGPLQPSLTHEHSEDDWDQVLAVNLTSVWRCMREELCAMHAAGRGAIVNIASMAGLVGAQGRCAYSASKHGVVGLTRTAALEYAKLNIRINAICPSPVLTGMVEQIIADQPSLAAAYSAVSPTGRMATPDDVAAAVVWLASPEARFVNGIVLPVDGGSTAR